MGWSLAASEFRFTLTASGLHARSGLYGASNDA
jgi:hypothetical protein